MPLSRTARAAGLALLAALYCAAVALLLTFGRIPSQSPDMAFHLQLLEVVRGRLQVPLEARAYLDEMFGYPRFSHRLAALASQFGLSSFNALTFAAAASASAVWLTLFLQARRVSASVLWGGLLAAALTAWLTRSLIGFEIVNNYFYPQLVSEAVAIMSLAAGAWLVRRSAWAFGLFAVLAVVFCGYFHLMGVLKLSGGLAVLAGLQTARRWLGGGRPEWGVLALAVPLVAAVVLHPAFSSMRSLSQNNGGIDFAYPFSIIHLSLCAVAVIGLSILVGWRSLRAEEASGQGEGSDFFIALGLATAAAFVAQALALAVLHEGSVYAAKKHAYGLFTALAFLLPLAASRLWRNGEAASGPPSLGALALALLAAQAALAAILAAAAVSYGVPVGGALVEKLRFFMLLTAVAAPVWAWLIGRSAGSRQGLAAVAFGVQVVAAQLLIAHVIYARPSQLDVARVSNILEHMRELRPRDAGGDTDHLFVSSKAPPTVAFVANLAGLRVDRGLAGPLSSAAATGDADVRGVKVLVTETGDAAYDVVPCRIAPPAGPIVTLDGGCVAKTHTLWDFAQGETEVDGAGWSARDGALWTTARHAQLALHLPAQGFKRPGSARLLIAMVGGETAAGQSRTARLRLAGGASHTVTFEAEQAPVRFVVLPAPVGVDVARLSVEASAPVGLRSVILLP